MLHYRRLQAKDDAQIARIIRTNLERFHLNVPGTVYFDPELDHLSEFYDANPGKRACFVVLDEREQVIGGIGIAEFSGIANCAELQKLYLDDSAKGKGYSKELIRLAETQAKAAGYQNLYLETHTNLEVARKLYEKMGFAEIEKPSTVQHGTMDHFYLKKL